jgi:TPR repeat protein
MPLFIGIDRLMEKETLTQATICMGFILTFSGRIYQNGKGCNVDYKMAQSFYTKAAQGGNLDAMVNLGFLLENGFGSDKNLKMAFRWYEDAASKEYSKAMNSLGSCYYKGSVAVERNPETAVHWFRKSAKLGNAHALNNLGICYEEGLGVNKDLGIAKQYYKDAAAHNHANATNNYGYMLLLEKSFDEAFRNFQLALALDSSDAAYNLGTIYETGCTYDNQENCLNADIEMSVKYYKLAAKKVSFAIF